MFYGNDNWMSDDYEQDRYVSPEQKEADLKALADFEARAKEIEESVCEKKKALIADFMAWQPALRKYQYDSQINHGVGRFEDRLGIYEYDSRYPDYWLPSNIGC